GVLSILTVGDVYVAVFPATSLTVTGPFTDAPSVVSDKGLGSDVEAMPDRLSVATKLTVTFVLFHPAAFAVGVGDPNVTVGGVLSILIPARVDAGLVLPALSMHVPEAD